MVHLYHINLSYSLRQCLHHDGPCNPTHPQLARNLAATEFFTARKGDISVMLAGLNSLYCRMVSLFIKKCNNDILVFYPGQCVGFSTLCFYFHDKIFRLNIPFSPLKCPISPPKVTKMLG